MDFLFLRSDIKRLILNILFLFNGLSIVLFYKNMFYLHIIVIALMILILIKCYYQGIKNGLVWLSLMIAPMVISMLRDTILTTNELSEILLILGPALIVGLLAERQRRYLKQLKETYIATLEALAEATDARDAYTQGHSERVANYAVWIARGMQLSDQEVNYLKEAALLHDIGKLAVPDRILHKKERLDEDEWLIMRKHPEYGQRILSKLDFLSPVLPIVLYHHRRFDEHKDSLIESESKVTVATRILTVADAFDAMTSDRPYRDKMSPEQALAELERCSGSQFDSGVVGAFKKVFRVSNEK